ncbi:MAG: MiaB/RimO family radical SAM methylthiotransferase [Lachnospiraceae bacterium]|nr:MiaB/RimO family radical SAM methylthiotransferase [Lachnospiraceae bacterium]
MQTVAFHNLGCKVNSYETEVMQQYFQKNGYSIVEFAQKADIYVINTCTVTNIADRKSRQMIHKAKALNPDAVVIAVGCYVQTHAADIEGEDGIDLAIGNNKKGEIVAIVEQYLTEKKPREGRREQGKTAAGEKTLQGATIPDLTDRPEYEELNLSSTMEHTRVYLKIQDGCNQFCSYCAIPYARGRVRSRKAEHILEEARRLAGKGYREIVLTGIHISSYGLDFYNESYNRVFAKVSEADGNTDAGTTGEDRKMEQMGVCDYRHSGLFLALVEQLAQVEGIERIRLGSFEPRIITEEFAKGLAAIKKVCPHFHLSLQSGCDSVLSRMNRQYTCADFQESVAILRKYFEDPAITTDLIAGFPGETKEEHEETLAFVEGIGFYETHIFPFSRRKGTAADKMPGQLTEKQKKERCEDLRRIHEKNRKAYMDRFLGKPLPVLWETTKQIEGKECFVGHSPNYLEIALPVSKAGGEDLTGEITEAAPRTNYGDGLMC